MARIGFPSISLVMIVKNESLHLAECLESAAPLVDEIIVVDTGSTDQTKEIARNYTPYVYSCLWEEDFSAARNFALRQATKEWILSLDADEKLLPETGDLRQLTAAAGKLEAYLLPMQYPVNAETGEYNHFLVLRLFKNNGRYFYQGKIHEQIIVPEEDRVGIAAGPVIRHRQLPPSERNRKRGRNLAYLKKALAADPNNPFLQYYLGIEWLALGKPQKAVPLLQQAWENLPENSLMFRTSALRYLILALKTANRLDEAFCLCLEADLKYPSYPDIYYLGGLIMEEKQEYWLAVKWLEEAVSCGTPPLHYSHLHGTESFLAYYHLGYCWEKLGNRQEAARYYEKALNAQPQYIYPLHQLFLVLLAQKGPRETFDFLRQKNFLADSTYAFTAAYLFFLAGYPQFSWNCVSPFLYCSADGKFHDETSFLLGKYSFSAGHFKTSRYCLGKVKETSKHFYSAQIYRALSFLLEENTAAARRVLLSLWPQTPSDQRAEIFLLLQWSRNIKTPKNTLLPSRTGGNSTARAALKIMEMLSSCQPANSCSPQQAERFSRLFNSFLSLLKTALPQGKKIISQHYQQKYQEAKTFFNYKFELAEEKSDEYPSNP